MKTYKCKYCGYKTQKENCPLRCNYCNKENSMYEIESAEKLIQEL